MPMFQETFGPLDAEPREGAGSGAESKDETNEPSSPISIHPLETLRRGLSRRVSEESIRTELCEGPIPDSPPKSSAPEEAVSNAVSDRAELIERLKRGESPTWIPNRHVCFSRFNLDDVLSC